MFTKNAAIRVALIGSILLSFAIGLCGGAFAQRDSGSSASGILFQGKANAGLGFGPGPAFFIGENAPRNWTNALNNRHIRAVGNNARLTGVALRFYSNQIAVSNLSGFRLIDGQLSPDVRDVADSNNEKHLSLIASWLNSLFESPGNELGIGAWQYEYEEEQDLRRFMISFSVYPPDEVSNLSLELIDANGNSRGWFRNDPEHRWTQVQLDPGQSTPQGLFGEFIDSASFDLSRVVAIRLSQSWRGGSGLAQLDPTTRGLNAWSAWNHLQVKPNSNISIGDGAAMTWRSAIDAGLIFGSACDQEMNGVTAAFYQNLAARLGATSFSYVSVNLTPDLQEATDSQGNSHTALIMSLLGCGGADLSSNAISVGSVNLGYDTATDLTGMEISFSILTNINVVNFCITLSDINGNQQKWCKFNFDPNGAVLQTDGSNVWQTFTFDPSGPLTDPFDQVTIDSGFDMTQVTGIVLEEAFCGGCSFFEETIDPSTGLPGLSNGWNHVTVQPVGTGQQGGGSTGTGLPDLTLFAAFFDENCNLTIQIQNIGTGTVTTTGYHTVNLDPVLFSGTGTVVTVYAPTIDVPLGPGEVYNQVMEDIIVDGDTLTIFVDPGGLVTESSEGNNGPFTISVPFQCMTAEAQEAQLEEEEARLEEITQNATPISIPYEGEGFIEPGEGRDCYSITVTETVTITIDVGAQALGSTLDSVVEVHDASGQIIAENDDQEESQGQEGSIDSKLTVTLEPGAYYICVRGFQGEGGPSTGFYVLNVSLE